MDTIFAPITSISNSSVAIIRISGDKSLKCLEILGLKSKPIKRQATLCNLYDFENKDKIDQVIITYFPAPHSFTGEDVVEINSHASIYIINKILQILSKIEGVRLANAGEFSKRAFYNNKMDLVQAQGISDLIRSETKEQHRQAMRQMDGDLSRVYEEWRVEFIKIMAHLEAFIDFPDEDLPQDLIADIEDKINHLKLEIKDYLKNFSAGLKIKNGISLAIIGGVNAGKSSLINYLSKDDIAIVSNIAGTTRDIVNNELEIAGIKVIISDTAGIRKSDNIIEKEGIKRSIKKAHEADIKILMIDASKIINFDQSNLDLIDEDSLIIINKVDLVKNLKIPNFLAKYQPILISIKDKINLDKIDKKLENLVRKISIPTSAPIINNIRYKKALENILYYLDNFSLKKEIELASEDIRICVNELGKITGKVNVDDILDVIFSQFCIGK